MAELHVPLEHFYPFVAGWGKTQEKQRELFWVVMMLTIQGGNSVVK